jgi:hypothetical protein
MLQNNTIKYDSTIKFFNELGEDYIIDYFLRFIYEKLHNTKFTCANVLID